MEFEEIFTSPFVSPTTCYSSSKRPSRRGFNDKELIEFATESHILGVEIAQNLDQSNRADNNDGSLVKAFSRPVPQDSTPLTCVGYSKCDLEVDNDHGTLSHEAIVLIDSFFGDEETTLLRDAEYESLNLYQPSQSSLDKDDSGSVVSTNDASVNTTNRGNTQLQTTTSPRPPQLHRRNSSVASATATPSVSGTIVTASSTANTATSSTSTGNATPPTAHHQKTKSELSTTSSISTTDRDTPGSSTGGDRQGHHSHNPSILSGISTSSASMDGKETAKGKNKHRAVLEKARGRLILSQGMEKGNITHDKPSPDLRSFFSLVLLDFRPLCPCLARWKIFGTPSGTDATEIFGVFVGSADDALLRFFIQSNEDPRSLVSVSLPEEPFSVETPVMALDFCTVQWPAKKESANGENGITTHTLAVACQDGTIQLITWKPGGNKDDLFKDITSKKFVVDGPLVCLRLEYNIYTSLRVTVGSLCGYVCQLLYDIHNNSWDGPHMIAENLWIPDVDAEDSVLAVDAQDNYIAVGTLAGRCILYATHDSDNYFPVWYALLPYSIHGIIIMKENEDSNNQHLIGTKKICGMKLAVTTRRSFHLFQATKGNVAWKQKPSRQRYSADLARQRLSQILQDIQKESKEQDARTKTLISETINDILSQVEKTVPVNNENEAATVVSNTSDNLLDYVEQKTTETIDQTNVPVATDVVTETTPLRPPQLEYSSSEDDERNGNESTAENMQISTTEEDASDLDQIMTDDDVPLDSTTHTEEEENGGRGSGAVVEIKTREEDDYVVIEANNV